MSQQKLMAGTVKQVLSGDTVIIRNSAKIGATPAEKTFCLSNIAAPKLGRKGPGRYERRFLNKQFNADTKDSPYAWESREFLRQLVLGEAVRFTMETETATGRTYGVLYVKKNNVVINVNEMLLQEGYATLRKDSLKAHPELATIETAAKNSRKGLHAGDDSEHIRDVKWNMQSPKEFFEENKKKTLKAIIEHIRDGSTYRGFFLPSFQYFTIMLSGAKAPGFKLDNDGKVDMANSDKYAESARSFIETRLLQKEVEIVIEDFTNTFLIGSVKHPKGDVAELLLQEGFARCLDRYMPTVAGGAMKLRNAEKLAKSKSLRIWESYKPAKTTKRKEISGTVVDVPYGDSIVVMMEDKSVMTCHLNNVRAPRPIEDGPRKPPGATRNRNLYDIPLMFEAREFLRELLIGQHVEATLEHKVDMSAENANVKTDIKRNYCLVKFGNINVAELLVRKGLATVGRTRADDEGRTACYDELLAAEAEAKEEGLGVNQKKSELVPMRVTELAGEKSKPHLSSFKRAGMVDALVEHCTSGSRFRCFVAKDNLLFTFLLSGINCPRNDKESPIGIEAQKLAMSLVQLRRVQLEVETLDRKGSFIGHLHVGGKNLAVRLLEEGFASMHFSAENSKYYNAFRAAEAKAKDKKLGVWEHETETPKAPKQDIPETRKIAPKAVRVSNVTTQGRLYAQYCQDGSELEKMMEELRQAFTNPPSTPFTPTKGQLCAAKFSDGYWYRALVEKIVKKQIHILYIDYGNREIATPGKLAALPPKLAMRSRYAHEMGLAFVKFPADEEEKESAILELINLVTDKVLDVNFEYKADGIEYFTVKDSTGKDIARSLINEGLVLVDNKREARFKTLIEDYQSAQAEAKKHHRNLWEYGDITEDDAFEFGMER